MNTGKLLSRVLKCTYILTILLFIITVVYPQTIIDKIAIAFLIVYGTLYVCTYIYYRYICKRNGAGSEYDTKESKEEEERALQKQAKDQLWFALLFLFVGGITFFRGGNGLGLIIVAGAIILKYLTLDKTDLC